MANSSSSSTELLTKQQLATMLQVSQRTIDRWLVEHRLPCNAKVIIATGSVRYRSNVVQQWINNGCPKQSEG